MTWSCSHEFTSGVYHSMKKFISSAYNRKIITRDYNKIPSASRWALLVYRLLIIQILQCKTITMKRVYIFKAGISKRKWSPALPWDSYDSTPYSCFSFHVVFSSPFVCFLSGNRITGSETLRGTCSKISSERLCNKIVIIVLLIFMDFAIDMRGTFLD